MVDRIFYNVKNVKGTGITNLQETPRISDMWKKEKLNKGFVLLRLEKKAILV